MQRTTINLEENLLEKIRAYGSRKGWSLSKTISELLKTAIFEKFTNKKKVLKWVTFRGQIKPGLDLDDRDSIYGMMEKDIENN